jgi:hypothetical protein
MRRNRETQPRGNVRKEKKENMGEGERVEEKQKRK